MGQTHTISRNNTNISRQGDDQIIVRLYDTDIVTIDRIHAKSDVGAQVLNRWDTGWRRNLLRITLDSGDWRTVTTKARINQVASQYGLGFRVTQDKGKWWVTIAPHRYPARFYDGIQFLVEARFPEINR